MFSPRGVAQGCRCQLLTGSCDGSTRSCDCPSPNHCKLTGSSRRELETHPKVVEAKERNMKEFEETRSQ